MVEVAGQGGAGLDLVVQEISAVMQVGSVLIPMVACGVHTVCVLPHLIVEVTGQRGCTFNAPCELCLRRAPAAAVLLPAVRGPGP
jgi:hypothetical protein